MLYGNGQWGTIAALPGFTVGDAGKLVRVNGAGTAIEYAGVPSWEQIAVLTASNSAQLDFTSGLDDTYDAYELRLEDLLPSTDDQYLFLRASPNAGTSWYSTGGQYEWALRFSAPSGEVSNSSTADSISDRLVLTRPTASSRVSNAAGRGVTGVLEFTNPEVSKPLRVSYRANYGASSTGTVAGQRGDGQVLVAAGVNGLRLAFSSGNIASGKARLLGLRK
uniref:Uncharacterized protein n=1 Tax=Bosea sp. NBC_00436 TaxID=2969620 RepID=A0A9E7ZLE7_9HYPH